MKKIIVFLIIILMVCGCNNTSNKTKNEVNVLNWTSYIPSEVIDDFEKEYGIKVNYGTYSSNEELLAKISSSKEGTYDVIFPSDYMVELMIKKDMLMPIDISKIPNYSNINSLFLNKKFDLNNNYSLPFLAATTVIAVNRDNIHDNISGYNDLLNDKYENNIVLLDDQRIVIGMSLQALGYDMNETDSVRLNKGKEWLLKINRNVKAFDSDSPKTFLITGETDIGVMWNAEAVIAKEYNPNIEIIYPKEGFAISLDNYTIVKGAKNIENSYKFINYLLRDDVNSKITEEYPYINTTNNNMNLGYEELEMVLNKASFVENIGSSISDFDKVWAEIK